MKLANSFGLPAPRVNTPGKLKMTLEEAFADDTPMVIEVSCEHGSEVAPWEFLMPAMYHMGSTST